MTYETQYKGITLESKRIRQKANFMLKHKEETKVKNAPIAHANPFKAPKY